MRLMLTATLIFVATGTFAEVQTMSTSMADVKPKTVAGVPIRPGLQTPADTANAMAQTERRYSGEQRQCISGQAREGDIVLSPSPALGFSGAAALDVDGKFTGIALLKPAAVAGPMNGTPATQTVLVLADTLREFLKANGVNTIGGSTDAKASVARVICVRK